MAGNDKINTPPGAAFGTVSGALGGGAMATVADLDGGIPVVFRLAAVALTGDVNITVPYKVRVVDAWAVATAAGAAGDTVQVKNGANAITNALDFGAAADQDVVRAADIDDANHEIAAAGTLRVTGASAVNAIVYVMALRVA